MAEENEPFYKTPAGIMFLAIIALTILFIIMAILGKKGGNRNSYGNSNSNYVAQGFVSPSLAGYI